MALGLGHDQGNLCASLPTLFSALRHLTTPADTLGVGMGTGEHCGSRQDPFGSFILEACKRCEALGVVMASLMRKCTSKTILCFLPPQYKMFSVSVSV